MNDDGFELPVHYKGREEHFSARLVRFGYSYKIEVEINQAIIIFEPDEERNWRAQLSPEAMDNNASISTELLQAIVHSLEEITG